MLRATLLSEWQSCKFRVSLTGPQNTGERGRPPPPGLVPLRLRCIGRSPAGCRSRDKTAKRGRGALLPACKVESTPSPTVTHHPKARRVPCARHQAAPCRLEPPTCFSMAVKGPRRHMPLQVIRAGASRKPAARSTHFHHRSSISKSAEGWLGDPPRLLPFLRAASRAELIQGACRATEGPPDDGAAPAAAACAHTHHTRSSTLRTRTAACVCLRALRAAVHALQPAGAVQWPCITYKATGHARSDSMTNCTNTRHVPTVPRARATRSGWPVLHQAMCVVAFGARRGGDWGRLKRDGKRIDPPEAPQVTTPCFAAAAWLLQHRQRTRMYLFNGQGRG